MDPAPALLRAPQAEVLEDVLREQFGPLPQLAAICRLKRLPSGGYSSTEDLQLVLERRRVANAKERERVSAGPREGRPGHPGLATPGPAPGRLTSPLPAPIPATHRQTPGRTQCNHSPLTGGSRGQLGPLRPLEPHLGKVTVAVLPCTPVQLLAR